MPIIECDCKYQRLDYCFFDVTHCLPVFESRCIINLWYARCGMIIQLVYNLFCALVDIIIGLGTPLYAVLYVFMYSAAWSCVVCCIFFCKAVASLYCVCMLLYMYVWMYAAVCNLLNIICCVSLCAYGCVCINCATLWYCMIECMLYFMLQCILGRVK